MATVDDRVVQMDFNNKNFESNVATSMSSLDKLKKSLDFSASNKGLADLQDSAGRFNLGPLSTSIDAVSTKLLGWGTIGVTALSNIVNKAVNAGVDIAKAFTVDPIKAGLDNYETQINAIQTILANTSQSGTNINDVNKALAELNTYANQTVYNFSEMTKNIGTFTAAGVDLDTSVNAIKGIANLAALSGSSSDQASTAMYQLSQAIAAGNVKLQDWNSVVNAGIGGQVFQKALYNTAVQFGTIKNAKVGETFEQWTAAGNSFRNSLQDGWLTSKVLTSTLSQFTGDMTDAQLAAQGFSKDQIAQIQQLGKTANASAVNIKTLTQLQQALKEEVSTAYAAIFKTVFGDINQATALFSKVHTTLENALTNPIYQLNTLLQQTADLGGRDKVLDGLTNAVHGFSAILKPVGDAWRDLFQPETAKELYQLTVGFDNLSKKLIPSAATLDLIRRSFDGVFALVDIGRQVLKGIVNVLRDVFAQFSGGPTAILKTTANLGDFLVKVDKAVSSGGQIIYFFQDLSKVVVAPIQFIKDLGKALAGLFDGFDESDAKAIEGSFGRITDRIDPLKKALGLVSEAWDGYLKLLHKISDALAPTIAGFQDAFEGLGQALQTAFTTGNFNGIFDVINTGLLGGILLLVKKFFKNGLSVDLGGGLLGGIKDSFEQLTGTLHAMEANVKADTLLKIAGAVGLLTLSVVALSLIDSDKLTKALTALSVGFGELLASMAILTKLSGTAGFLKIPVIAASMILLALAIDVLVLAVLALSTLDWEQLSKGLVGVGALLLELTVATKPIAANSAGMISAGLGILAISAGLLVLSLAVKTFATMDWEQIGKGLAAVAASLLIIAGTVQLMPKDLIFIGPGVLAIAVALAVLASAIAVLGNLDSETLEKGLSAIALALIGIGLATKLMGPEIALIGPGLIAVGVALNLMAAAIKIFATMSWEEIGKGMAVLASSLVLLAGGLYLMEGALPGAAALLVAAGAIALLAPALKVMGDMSWTAIAKGMATLAASFLILGAAGLVLAPVAPALLLIGAAILIIGAGVLLAGAGVGLLAAGLSALATVGSAGVAVLIGAVTGLGKALPDLLKNLAEGIVDVIVIIGDSAPKFVGAFAKVLDALLDAVIKETPKITQAIEVLIGAFIKIINDKVPDFIKSGLLILQALLKGIADNIGGVTTSVANIVINFLNALAAKIPSIIAAGLNILVQFLNGIAQNIGKVSDAGINIVTTLITSVASKIPDIIQAGVDVIVNFLTGIASAIPQLVQAAVNVAISFVNALAQQSDRFANAALAALVSFMNGLADAINKQAPQLRKAGENIAFAIADGMTGGLLSKTGDVAKAAGSLASSAYNSVTGLLHINSPSKLFIGVGQSIGEGLEVGLDKGQSGVEAQAAVLAQSTVDAMSNALKTVPDLLGGVINSAPVISPVLDLTNVTKDATKINGLLASTPINVDSQLATAASISAATQATATAADAVEAAPTPAPIIFQQTNTSPVALDATTIYRNTKNQISLAKEALSL